jgi:receptor protein-tyrosine kinase
VSSNLALALAEIGRPVLLIDGDLRKGRLHDIFQVSNAWGLSDLLAGKKPPAGRDKMYFETCYPRLSLLPAGSTPSSIAGLLHSPGALEFLNRMREEFHTVLIDTPPMLQMSDARVLGRLADAVILVVRSAQTTRDEVMAAAQRLAEDGTRVLGSVLNEWDPRKASHAGYSHPYRQYLYDVHRG